MFDDSVLRTQLLDLLRALQGTAIDPILAGGYGLFLWQQVRAKEGKATVLAGSHWPSPRATGDLDLFLRLELVADAARMAVLRKALHRLGYEVVEAVKYTQFVKPLGQGRQVKVDLLAGPDVRHADRRLVRIHGWRVKPQPGVGLHARLADDAVGIEQKLRRIRVHGALSTGEPYSTDVLLPNGFTYLVMKLCAFRDRKDDPTKDRARHHAVDLFRIAAMLTEDEYEAARGLSEVHREDSAVTGARAVVAEDFSSAHDTGVLRLRERQASVTEDDLNEFLAVLAELFPRPCGDGTPCK